MKRRHSRWLEDIVSEVLSEPLAPTDHHAKSYLNDWLDPSLRSGLLRRLSTNYFVGSLDGHSIDEIETYLHQFIADVRIIGKERAAKDLYIRLMGPALSNGGPPLED